MLYGTFDSPLRFNGSVRGIARGHIDWRLAMAQMMI
jgi:hypothetical protein